MIVVFSRVKLAIMDSSEDSQPNPDDFVPAYDSRGRTGFLVAVSAFFVFMVAPVGFFAVGYLTLLAYFSKLVLAPKKRFMLFGVIALALLPIILSRLDTSLGPLYTFGIAFSTVKSIGVIIDTYAKKSDFKFRQVALFMYFFPLFTIGPVERIEKFGLDSFNTGFPLPLVLRGLARIVVGIFIVNFICDTLIGSFLSGGYFSNSTDFASYSTASAWMFVVLKFLYTYLNFVGFVEIAIGSGALFGIVIVENFDRPLLATNVQEFWRRYHISMGNWITRYLFFPIVGFIRKDWSNYVATLFAFTVFGAWHAFTLNYLFWGLMHGLALGGGITIITATGWRAQSNCRARYNMHKWVRACSSQCLMWPGCKPLPIWTVFRLGSLCP